MLAIPALFLSFVPFVTEDGLRRGRLVCFLGCSEVISILAPVPSTGGPVDEVVIAGRIGGTDALPRGWRKGFVLGTSACRAKSGSPVHISKAMCASSTASRSTFEKRTALSLILRYVLSVTIIVDKQSTIGREEEGIRLEVEATAR